MGKRYVYVRVPTDGKPYRGTDDKHLPKSLLAEIGTTASLRDGQVMWPGSMMLELEPALRAAFVVFGPDDRELNEHDSWTILYGALVQLVRKNVGKPLAGRDLIAAADRLAAEHFRQPECSYLLLTSLSIDRLPAKSVKAGESTITALAKTSSRFPLPNVLSMRSEDSRFSRHLNGSRYQRVKVTTEGRTVYEAVERGLNAVNLVRGLWSLSTTYGSGTFTLGGAERKPLGVIHTGPLHTLHHPDGQPAAELYWYDPDYSEEQELFTGGGKWKVIETFRRSAMKRLAASPFRTDVEALLIRYVSALDQPNNDLAFLQMWSILEKVTGTVGGNYDETIERTLWPAPKESRSLEREILQTLRFRRNQYVHSGQAGAEGDQTAYMIKSFVDPHLRNLILNRFDVQSLEEYGRFLSLPTNVESLRAQRSRLGRAMRVKEAQERRAQRSEGGKS